jgi:zinc protease
MRRLFRRSYKRVMLTTICAALIITTMPLNTFSQQETAPPPSAPRSVQYPKPTERTLPNGLRVIVVERGGSSLVASQLLIKNGGEVDPPQLAGLANMTANLLTKGTTTRTAPQIAEAIEALGGSLDTGARWDASTASVNVMSSRLEPAMEILADVVRRPVFKEEEVSRLRQQMLDELSVELSEPGTLAAYVAARVVFGDTPYGHSPSGTPETIERIKRDDILRLHTNHYRPDNSVLVIGGDIKPETAFKLAERLFGDWKKPGTPLPQPNDEAKAINKESKPRVVVVDMEHAGQAAVVLTRAGLKRTDPDYFRALVANSILGGGYSARLNQEIRIKRGLSYGASSMLDVRRNPGPFMAGTQTKNESGALVATILMDELGRLANAPIADTELTPRKAALTGSFARGLETALGLVTQVASLALHGLSLSEINNYINNVQAVTASEVQKIAGTRLGAKDANIIIVGRAKDFIDELRKRFPEVEVIREDELDLNRATLRKANMGSGSGGAMKK